MKSSYRHNYFSGTKKRERGDDSGRRIMALRVVILLFASLLSLRLFNLQVLSYESYKLAADDEHNSSKKLLPHRGEIFVRDHHASDKSPYLLNIGGEKLFPAVTNRDYHLVYAVSRDITEPEKTADLLQPILGTDRALLLEKFKKPNDSYQVLKHKVSDEDYDKIRALKLPGIGSSIETFRFYPEKGLGGQVFGFLGYAGDIYKGVYGLEGYFDDILTGKEGLLKLETDILGAFIPTGDKRIVDAVNGSSLVLTMDRTVQMVTCDHLKKWVLKHGADGGSAIVMDPKTGAIIAMCSAPDFDPEEYSKADVKLYPNPAIFRSYEPGSTFKAITMAIGLDAGKVTPQTTYEDTGQVKIAKYTIKNSDGKANGRQTMIDVLDKSLNTGAIFVARKVGLENYRKQVQAFGFGSPTGIELDTEAKGRIDSLSDKNDIYLATNSFGQGLTVTPLQLVTAYGAIANGGKLMQPYIVDEIIKPDGTKTITKPRVVRQVISAQAASLLGGMLVSVVRNGHGKPAGVDGYFVAGKTGTAQIPRKDGRGYETNDSIGSFTGFAPVDDPHFVMMVKIDHPRDVQWAESSAAPLFGDLAKFLLDYYEVPPDDIADKNKK